MRTHRSLGEFSIENADSKTKLKIISSSQLDESQPEKWQIEPKTNDGENGGEKGSLPKVKVLANSGSVLYSFPDLLAVVFSYLFFFLSSGYVENLDLNDVYKKNGTVFLFFVSFGVNGYYLLRPFSKKIIDFLDKISLLVISSLFLCAICAVLKLIDGNPDVEVFEKIFFWGSIIFLFDNICFCSGLKQIKNSLSMKNEYVFSQFVNIASNESLKNATIEQTSLKNLKRNDLVYLKIGDIVCFDGEVVDGEAIVARRVYAGKAQTSILSKKVYVFAGTKVLNGEVIVRVDNLLEDTFIFDNISMCQEVIDQKENIFSKKVYLYYVTALVILFLVQFFIFSYRNIDGLIMFAVSGAFLFSFLKIFTTKNEFVSLLLKKAFSRNVLLNKREVFKDFFNIKNYVFDFIEEAFSKNCIVEGFKLYDERIDEAYFLEALFSVFSRSDSPILKSVCEYISKKQNVIKVYKLENYVEYSDINLISSLSGTKFIVGDEPFMLEMKVQAQESDFITEAKGKRVIYIALNDIIVGHFILMREFNPLMEKLLTQIKNYGGSFYLMSQEPEGRLDDIGRVIGVELSRIHGGLSLKRYLEKLSTLGEYIFFANLNTDKKILNSSKHNVGIFDPVLCEVENLDVVNFDNSLEGFVDFIGYLLSLKKFMRHFWIFLGVSSLIVIASSFDLVYLLLSIFILSNLFLILFRYRAEKF